MSSDICSGVSGQATIALVIGKKTRWIKCSFTDTQFIQIFSNLYWLLSLDYLLLLHIIIFSNCQIINLQIFICFFWLIYGDLNWQLHFQCTSKQRCNNWKENKVIQGTHLFCCLHKVGKDHEFFISLFRL